MSAAAPPISSATVLSPAHLAARCHRPLIGVAAVLLGAFLSSLNTRLTTFGLADIRDGMGLGFDEGSWLTTVFGAAQMVVAPSAAWLSTAVGTRRFMLWTSVIFAVTSLLVPFTRDFGTIIVLQLLRGLAVAPSFRRLWVSFCAASRRAGGSGGWRPTHSASCSRRTSRDRSMSSIRNKAPGSESAGRTRSSHQS